MECQHEKTYEGPRVRRRYGSSGTEVCESCFAWRMTFSPIMPWRTDNVHDAAAESEEDEI